MRDTLIGLLLFLGIVGIYVAAKRERASVSETAASSTFQKNQPTQISKNTTTKNSKTKHSIKIAKGDKHESTNHRSRKQVQHHEQSARPSEPIEQIEKLTSIYQDEGSEASAAVTEAAKGNSLESDGDAASKPAHQVIHGVPVASWIRSQKNKLAQKVEPQLKEGIQVYFGCMKLKKQGPEYLNERDCEALALQKDLPFKNTY